MLFSTWISPWFDSHGTCKQQKSSAIARSHWFSVKVFWLSPCWICECSELVVYFFGIFFANFWQKTPKSTPSVLSYCISCIPNPFECVDLKSKSLWSFPHVHWKWNLFWSSYQPLLNLPPFFFTLSLSKFNLRIALPEGYFSQSNTWALAWQVIWSLV